MLNFPVFPLWNTRRFDRTRSLGILERLFAIGGALSLAADEARAPEHRGLMRVLSGGANGRHVGGRCG